MGTRNLAASAPTYIVGALAVLTVVIAYGQGDPTYEPRGQRVDTIKEATYYEINATNDETDDNAFRNGRGGRIINRSGGAVTITFWECETRTGTYVVCEDVSSLAVSNNSSKEIPAALFGSRWLKAVLSSGTATLYVVSAE